MFMGDNIDLGQEVPVFLISFIPCSVYKSNVFDFPTTFIHLY
jgi:hypothetical protein